MKCPNCKEEIPNDVKFCTKCGANIEEIKKASIEKSEKNETDENQEIQKKEKLEEKRVENKSENEKKESKSEEKPKQKKNTKKIIIVVLLILVLLAGTGAGIYLYLQNHEKQQEQEKVLEWGEVYLEILNDDKKLENLENMKIGLIDLDQDQVPELIIQGINSAKERIATVYKINDQNKVDTLNIMMNDDFTFKLVYDLKVDKYIWYAVAKENTDTPQVYDLNIETKKYEQELLDRDYKNDLVIIDAKQNEMTDFNKELSKDERKEKFEQAKDNYITTEEMITDEIKEKVELAKAIRDIEKIDSNKEIVYAVVSKKLENNTYEYPCININSEDVKKINQEIEEKYGIPSNLNTNNAFEHLGESEEISYKYTINKNILSLIVWNGGNESIWADTYAVDLKTSKKLTSEELITEYGFKKDEIITKATETVTNEFNNIIQKEKTALGSTWETLYGSATSEWEQDIKPYVEELHIFINDNNELCILGKYQHGGGQWSCFQTVIINITDDYKLSELPFKDGTTFDHYVVNYTTPETSTTPSPSQTTNSTANQNTATVPNVSFKTSSTVVPEGTYKRGNNGTLIISNSKPGQFDFSMECTYMTQAGYPNIGMISGTAKSTATDFEFAYTERKSNGAYFDYNLIFTIGDAEVISVDEQCENNISPYCGHNVTLEGTFIK